MTVAVCSGCAGPLASPADKQIGRCYRCSRPKDAATLEQARVNVEPTLEQARPKVDAITLEAIAVNLLHAIGEDPGREGLRDTPRRFAEAWREFIEHDPGTVATAFDHAETDQLVMVGGMRLWSVCEHHLVPFWCDVTVGYIPHGRVLGLSKFARIAHKHAHRLQLQERLVQGIADEVSEVTGSPDVAVVGTGEHLCMVMRGVRTPALVRSSVMRGSFREHGPARGEFLALLDRGRA